jgi:hypothetical protein
MTVSTLFCLFLSSVSAFHSCSSCALRQQLQAPVRLLHTFRRPSFGTFSLQFFSQDSENFDAKIVLIGSEICYTFSSQQLVPRLGNVLLFVYPTTLSSLSLSRACEPCDLLVDFAYFFFFSDIDVC